MNFEKIKVIIASKYVGVFFGMFLVFFFGAKYDFIRSIGIGLICAFASYFFVWKPEKKN